MHTRARLALLVLRCLLLVFCCLPLPAAVTAMPRSYLAAAGGANVLLDNVDGDVIDERLIGQFELGIGTHLGDRLLLEATFGVLGAQQQEGTIQPIYNPEDLLLPESARAYRLEANPLMLRLRYARGGMRTGYLKPEFDAGVGLYSVTRWLRPIPPFEPESINELLAAFEVGVSALLILDKNWMAVFGPRYTLTQRSDLVDDTNSLDGISILFGLRFFLNSPRDEPGGAGTVGHLRR